MLEQTLYMQGGGYLLSRDLVARVANRAFEPLHYLPEDAVMARVIGREAAQECMCSDLRMVKAAYDFQNVDLFANSERALPSAPSRDYCSRALHSPEDARPQRGCR